MRRRLRDLGITLGVFPTGEHNAITDVAGVRVGHTTLIEGEPGPRIRGGGGPVRTGLTAVMPFGGNVFHDRVVGGGFVLNGAGEVSGMTQLLEWGLLETPIFLTNTLSVGTVSSGAVRRLVRDYPGIGAEHDVLIPVVGECDDSWLNDIAGQHVTHAHVDQALDSATDGPVAEGNVGGGTGMVCFDLKGGIGTASRKLPDSLGGYTLGMLVMTNFGVLEDLHLAGHPIGKRLAKRFAELAKRKNNYGSIIAVMATDAPLLSQQISRVCKRVALGIGRAGSYAAHGSGEIVIGFSTTNRVPRVSTQAVYQMDMLRDTHIDPLYRAAIEATEEAIFNALCMAEDMRGRGGFFCPALPLDEVERVAEILARADDQA